MNETYALIKHLRKAQEKFYDKNSLDGAYWRVNIEVLEMDCNFETPLKRVVDEDRR